MHRRTCTVHEKTLLAHQQAVQLTREFDLPLQDELNAQHHHGSIRQGDVYVRSEGTQPCGNQISEYMREF